MRKVSQTLFAGKEQHKLVLAATYVNMVYVVIVLTFYLLLLQHEQKLKLSLNSHKIAAFSSSFVIHFNAIAECNIFQPNGMSFMEHDTTGF